VVAFLTAWRPSHTYRPAIGGASRYSPAFEGEIRARDRRPTSTRETLEALAPYLIMIATLSLGQAGPIKRLLAGATQEFRWPGLDVTGAGGEALTATTFRFDPLAATGSLLLISGLVTMLVLRTSPRTALAAYGETLGRLGRAMVTVASVLALAYVMNFSGQTITLGRWLAGAGAAVAFLSSMIGWLGVAITGSDTASNALFGALQVTAANHAGLSPTLLAAANSSGGVLGKMLSPQHLAIGAAAAGIAGREGDVLRVVLKWSLILIVLVCVLVYLQSTAVLGWMVTGP
jgi:lactate permease